MKEYRLAAWPQLGSAFDRIAYRRMLSDMSLRHMTLAQLANSSGASHHDIRSFLDMLGARGVIAEREAPAPDSLFGSLRPLGGWLRKALSNPHDSR